MCAGALRGEGAVGARVLCTEAALLTVLQPSCRPRTRGLVHPSVPTRRRLPPCAPLPPRRSYNILQSVMALWLAIDVVSDESIEFVGAAAGVGGYERAAAAFLFILCGLSLAAGVVTSQTLAEIKQRAVRAGEGRGGALRG